RLEFHTQPTSASLGSVRQGEPANSSLSRAAEPATTVLLEQAETWWAGCLGS
ncbi:hypothetical protein PoB_000138300, partial [Plakobranchus ocellatus]